MPRAGCALAIRLSSVAAMPRSTLRRPGRAPTAGWSPLAWSKPACSSQNGSLQGNHREPPAPTNVLPYEAPVRIFESMVTGETNEESGSAARRPRWAADFRSWLTKPKPIGFYLFLLIFVTLLPAIGVSLVLLQRNNETQRDVLTILAEATAGSIAEGVDRELISMVTTLRVLSTTPSLVEGDIEDFYERAQSALAGTGSYLILLDEQLNQ